MEFSLTDLTTGKRFIFPVNPAEVSIKRGKLYDTINIINLGEIDFTHGQKVREITFASFFPQEYDASYCNYPDLPEPGFAMNLLTEWMIGRQVLELTISETEVNRIPVLISAHNTTFRGGEPGDVYFEITCRTWREVKVRTAAEADTEASGANSSRTGTNATTGRYTVVPEDYLVKIAKMQLNDSSRWGEIYDLNRDLIGPDPDKIYPGQELVMP
ncbi:MAG: LysM peptidoglycan-binding domain-containing protein [Firmicutes bacterium]|nr:LysM peptidoglycan-binding domain-containing protein [Bacillota bacterium]